MAGQSPNHLNHISTCWSVVCRAHSGVEGIEAARQALLDRYGGVVHRYLQGALRDPMAAADLFQEFALRLLRGDFRRAAPEFGRFRDFVKTAVLRLVRRYAAGQQARPPSLNIDVPDPALSPEAECEQAFLRSWRAELLARAWQALSRYEQETGRPFYRVLRLRVDEPGRPSQQLAILLSEQLGTSVSAVAARQLLHRARERFAAFLLDEVTQSLAGPTPDDVAQELAELGLLQYCRPALAKNSQAPAAAQRPA